MAEHWKLNGKCFIIQSIEIYYSVFIATGKLSNLFSKKLCKVVNDFHVLMLLELHLKEIYKPFNLEQIMNGQ